MMMVAAVVTVATADSSVANDPLSLLAETWAAYNAPDSFLPLYIPLILWVSSFLYCYLPSKSPRPVFHKWYALHNLHNFGAIGLGTVSLFCNDDAVFNERIPILWSIGYFTVDLIECTYRMDMAYLFHAFVCLALGLFNYTLPLSRELRMNSKASFCELSNPFMHLSRKTRRPLHFLTFTFVYTLCRIVWIPIMMYQVFQRGVSAWHPVAALLGGFYALNLFWYYKVSMKRVEGGVVTGMAAEQSDSTCVVVLFS